MGKENGSFRTQASVAVSFCSRENGKGKELCTPRIRNQYLFCYLAAGHGVLSAGDKEQHLSEGQGLLILPNTVLRFEAEDRPWELFRIGFDGTEIPEILEDCGLTEKTPMFRTDDCGRLTEVLKAMIETFEWDRNRRYNLLALFYSAVSLLQPTEPQHRKSERAYVKKALDYIHNNYADRVRIEDLARYVGLDRTYLFKLFVKNVGQSPQEYLIRYRLDRAVALLTGTDLSAEQIATACGFRDSPSFCKHFKANLGISPLAYRKKNRRA